MSLANVAPLTVEVAVQDEFAAAVEGFALPISPELWEDWFGRWLTYLNPDLTATQAYELSLRLTTDAEVQTFNAQYRQVDRPTDVLAFAALEVDYPQPEEAIATQPLYLGDLVISVETAQRQAEERGHSLKEELAWLATHGLLHLLGWDHPDETSLTRMLRKQDDLLQIIGLRMQYD